MIYALLTVFKCTPAIHQMYAPTVLFLVCFTSKSTNRLALQFGTLLSHHHISVYWSRGYFPVHLFKVTFICCTKQTLLSVSPVVIIDIEGNTEPCSSLPLNYINLSLLLY